MAVSLDGLDPDFSNKVQALLQSLVQRGLDMRPCAAVRPPIEQARLWRQSRAKEEIDDAIARLRGQGGAFLAAVLQDAGPQHGPHVTNSLPGFSWHQWGEAVDCFWAVNGTAEWSTTRIVNGVNGYKVYAADAKAAGLTAGGLWPSFKDWPHVQLRTASSPTAAGMTVRQINDTMEQRFG